MKLGMSHCGHKRIPDAKFESSIKTLLVFEIYVTKFPSEEANKSSDLAIYSRKMGLALKN